MLFPVADLGMPYGPPPQGILEKKCHWNLLLVLLSACFILRFIALDVPGALLSGLMMAFAVIMTRDGMQEVLRYALVFAVLCFLNFFFDILPLMTELGGRVKSRTVPVTTRPNAGGERETVYKMVVSSRPFFDAHQGLTYNVQSIAMILSPIAMALGCYLAVSAHLEAQRSLPELFEPPDIREELNEGLLQRGALNRQSLLQEQRLVANSEARRTSVQNFSGQSFKLGPDTVEKENDQSS